MFERTVGGQRVARHHREERLSTFTKDGEGPTRTVTETDLAESMVASAQRGLRVLVSPDRAKQGDTIPIQTSLVIGRDPAAGEGVAFLDPLMSRRHIIIERKNKHLPIYELVDIGSKNGTSHNGIRVASRFLEDGSVIRVGGTVMLFGQLPDHPVVIDEPFVGVSRALESVLEQIDLIADKDMTVLINGSNGTGKELAARRIHERSGRTGPFVPVNCGALPAGLIESLLFGHRKGAFTGADQNQIGYFQDASNGTLFLDEIGELPLELQPKLLRVLETREFSPLGSTTLHHTNARIVAATNRDLRAQTDSGAFRLDLLARLCQFTLTIPPLRERREDVLPIAQHLLRLLAPDRTFDWAPDAVEALLLYDWPMNVRELHAVMQRVALLETAESIVRLSRLPEAVRTVANPPASPTPIAPGAALAPAPRLSSRAPDQETLTHLLSRSGGNVAQVAKALNKDRKQVYRWLRKYGLDPEAFRSEES